MSCLVMVGETLSGFAGMKRELEAQLGIYRAPD